MLEAKQNLRELTILKFRKLTPNEILELESLRERMTESGFVEPAGYFRLNRGTLLASRIVLVAFILLLMSCK